MRTEIRVTGLGGQGVILVGVLLGTAAVMYENKNAIQTQSYGSEATGTLSESNVIISDKDINFQKVRKSDIFVAFCQQAYDAKLEKAKKDSFVIVEKDLVHTIRDTDKYKTYAIPALVTAEDIGKKVVMNMVILGAIVGITHVVNKESIIRAIKETTSSRFVDLNLQAFNRGYELGINAEQL